MKTLQQIWIEVKGLNHDWFYVMPDGDRFGYMCSVRICPDQEANTNRTVHSNGLGPINNPREADGVIDIDGVIYEYAGADCKCTDAEIAQAIRDRQVDRCGSGQHTFGICRTPYGILLLKDRSKNKWTIWPEQAKSDLLKMQSMGLTLADIESLVIRQL